MFIIVELSFRLFYVLFIIVIMEDSLLNDDIFSALQMEVRVSSGRLGNPF